MKLHPNYPIIEGKHQLAEDWSLVLEGKFNKRFEDSNIVIWQSGLTFWIEIIELESLKEDILKTIKGIKSKTANNIQEKSENDLIRYQYELIERDKNRKVNEYLAIYSFTIKDNSYIQCAAYCDTNKSIELANKIIQSIYG